MSRRIRDYGISIGEMKTGPMNSISDVSGVEVGHVTLDEGNIKTGVTVVIPAQGNLFRDKLMASCHIINGFGKSTGLVQIEELGTLETPIIMTNTLSVGDCSRGLVDYMLSVDSSIGTVNGTVNPVICECNDGFLNDIRGLNVKPCHVREAVEKASPVFNMGDVGAGKGMSCYQLKGGIGSSSRLVEIDGDVFTTGVLVLSNFGEMADFRLDGEKKGREILKMSPPETLKEQGSIIVIIATDAPMSERQLKRLCKRASVGITRTGSYIGNGSGEIAIAFSTANRIGRDDKSTCLSLNMVNDRYANLFFRSVVESVEEAILDSMICASTVEGRDNHERKSLSGFISK